MRPQIESKLTRAEFLLFFILLVSHLAHIWSVPVFLTQDGPSHVNNSRLFLNLLFGEQGLLARDFYVLNWSPVPNWFTTIALSGLMVIFPPIVAEKLFLSVLIVTTTLSFRSLLGHIAPEALGLSGFGFLFSNSVFLYLGFYNFQWGLAFLFLFIAQCILWNKDRTKKIGVITAALGVLLFFTHPILALIALVFWVSSVILHGYFCERKFRLQRLFVDTSVVAPLLLLFLNYFLSLATSQAGIFRPRLHWIFLEQLVALKQLIAFSDLEQKCFSILILILLLNVVAGVVKRANLPAPELTWSFVGVGGLSVFTFFFISDHLAGGSEIHPRMALLFVFSLILFAASLNKPKELDKYNLWAAFCIPIAILILRWPYQQRAGALAGQYLKAQQAIPDRCVYLPANLTNLGYTPDGILSPRIEIFIHMGCYLGATGDRICLDNYEAVSEVFPLRWLPEVDPSIHLSVDGKRGLGLAPPAVNLIGYRQNTGFPIDFVVLWAGRVSEWKSFSGSDLGIQVHNEYHLIPDFSDDLTRIYRRMEVL